MKIYQYSFENSVLVHSLVRKQALMIRCHIFTFQLDFMQSVNISLYSMLSTAFIP